MTLKSNILVTGGAGYIGSHMVLRLLANNYNPIVFDNLSEGHIEFVPKDVTFVKGDLRNYADIESVFEKHKIDAVMHFAGLISVAESVKEPKKYQQNNIDGGNNLLKAMGKYKVTNLIFSSTAAVYESEQGMPLTEDAVLKAKNPYGETKLAFEKIIQEKAASADLNFIIFRYFNAGGADLSQNIGEAHSPETHLIPNILRSVRTEEEFSLFGDNYPTPDGTCVRDYIHVSDICEAHLLGLKNLLKGVGNQIFNVGTGSGYTVKEVIIKAEEVTGSKINYTIKKRRDGDASILVASFDKAKEVLGWEPKYNLADIIESAYAWENKRNV